MNEKRENAINYEKNKPCNGYWRNGYNKEVDWKTKIEKGN